MPTHADSDIQGGILAYKFYSRISFCVKNILQ